MRNISRVEAYSLMSEADHKNMNDRIKELDKVIHNKIDWNLQFYINEEQEVFLELLENDVVRYEMWFNKKETPICVSCKAETNEGEKLQGNYFCFVCIENDKLKVGYTENDIYEKSMLDDSLFLHCFSKDDD